MSTPNSQIDDLEAVRIASDALKSFDKLAQTRILRWVAERVGLPEPYAGPNQSLPIQPPANQKVVDSNSSLTGLTGTIGATDIKSFVDSKAPKNDNQFAATIAYYYQFVASEAERKNSISSSDLTDACRKVGRARKNRPSQTLINAHQAGLLDRDKHGRYSINAVGENLVAMTLPSTGEASSYATPNRAKKRKATTRQKLIAKKRTSRGK